MSAAPAYPASALYETFSNTSARAKLIACYTPGKQRDPKLRGKVIVKFTINADGMAKPVENNGSNLTDDAVIACVVRTIKTLHFQKPLEGSVTVVYPFIFRPTGDETLILPDAGKK
jgi:outer membrane biosynthesis protein TonB